MIVGDRIELVPLAPEHFDLTLKWINNPNLRVMTGTRFPVSQYEHEGWFKSRATDKYNKTYVIRVKENLQVIGIIGNSEYDPINRMTNIFVYIGETDFKGKGYGQESLNLYINFCFNEINIHKIIGYLYEYNKASRNMLEKCGYILEGTLKNHWFKDGKYHDVLVMGALNE